MRWHGADEQGQPLLPSFGRSRTGIRPHLRKQGICGLEADTGMSRLLWRGPTGWPGRVAATRAESPLFHQVGEEGKTVRGLLPRGVITRQLDFVPTL